MNDFTKEELQIIREKMCIPYDNDYICRKLQSMIENYCEHENSCEGYNCTECKDCGARW